MCRAVFVHRKFRRIHQPWRWVPFGLRLRFARCRAWLVRHRFLRRAFLVAVLVVPAFMAVLAISGARQAQQAWGTATEVVVARSAVASGDAVGPDDFRLVRMPSSFLPDDALSAPIDEEEIATRSLRAGDVVTRRDIRSLRDDLDLPSGKRAVSLPADPRLPPLQPGDTVDLYVMSADAGFGRALEPSRRLDEVATVIDVADEAVTLAVAPRNVAELITASSVGRVLVALR